METTIFWSHYFGFLLIISGVSVLVDRKFWGEVLVDILRSPGLRMMSGLIPLMMGLGVVLQHNIWLDFNTSLVSLFGWLFVVGGVFRLCFAKSWFILAMLFKDRVPFRFIGVLYIVLGLVFLMSIYHS